MDTSHVITAVLGLLVGCAGTSWFAMAAVRHEKRKERLGFAATLARLADDIRDANDPVDPRRIGYTLRMQAGLWQRAADALQPNTTKEN